MEPFKNPKVHPGGAKSILWLLLWPVSALLGAVRTIQKPPGSTRARKPRYGLRGSVRGGSLAIAFIPAARFHFPFVNFFIPQPLKTHPYEKPN